MASTTYTATTFTNLQPKQNATGNQTVSGQFKSGANVLSAGDVIFLAKIPHGARIVEFAVDHSTSETNLGVDYGMETGGSIAGGGADLSQFATALARATIIRHNLRRASGNDGYVVSVSDSSAVRYGIFACKPVSGSASTSFIVNFSITYRCDE